MTHSCFSSFVIAPHNFSIDNELMVISGFITTSSLMFAEIVLILGVPAFKTPVSACSFEMGVGRNPKRKEDLILQKVFHFNKHFN